MKARHIIIVALLLFAGTASADEHGITWDSLNADQQSVLGRFSGEWDSLPPQGQEGAQGP